ncbi:hypothetical protein A6F53_08120 [Levilactobacillus brevis]|uniref:hypothetical protein n=1 Tax=Levilactobacillus brevis TaxID=1580 RepID=UPI00046715AA|nr:hypothetical protein [Levilactobacillus brevis]DAP36981.1 MAG TPA: hypothetical protein [Caudoviricetes sp.]ANN49212.1 hypothetical protein A6F53_08120 [Levilactobacillus brevis]ATU69054.1 hypothetical protein CT113_01385 [Levilactobacillus brevis]MCT2886857.1 hypothetical protein [Levilactobacillus brevis]MCT3574187.1 hypothetical protein [Levilactobacillus brevis]
MNFSKNRRCQNDTTRKIDTIKDTLGLTDGQLKAMLAADELPGEQDKRLNRLFKDAGKVLNQQAGLNEEDLEFSF